MAGSLVWDGISDSRQTSANHAAASQLQATLAADFAQQLEWPTQRSTPTDADLRRAAQQALAAVESPSGPSPVTALGFEALEPVTRGPELTVDVKAVAYYRVAGIFVSSSLGDTHCFQVRLPLPEGPSAKSAVTPLPSCPATPTPIPAPGWATRSAQGK
ncbi:hypothetical protein GXP74_25610 [Streptacidiphilus sp. P02-A3a]|nr:hypothetical protein GXP74_25610 [Streptacidiphilus sp. P02-A3a]